MKIVDYYYNFRQKANDLLDREYAIPVGHKAWVKRAKVLHQPISFFNGCNIYFDETSLPPICSNVTDLSNQYVLYGILCNGKFYMGKTTDFGERMSTHAKDARNNTSAQLLYQDMIRTGECLVFAVCIAEDKETFDRIEHSLISLAKEFSIEKGCNFNNDLINVIKESIRDSKEYSSKYCYNIAD